jgi:hypothetical protein
MVSSKKTANVSVIVMVSNHRKNTAACVSLSKSTMSKTREPQKRPNRLTPDLGGGGDLVAPEVRVNRPPKRISTPSPTLAGQPVQPLEVGGGGSLRKADLRVNRVFSDHFAKKNKAFRPQKTVRRSERLPSDFVAERFDWSAETMSAGLQKQEVF